MNSEITDIGWKETTIKNFRIKSIRSNPFNTTVKEWIESTERLNLKNRSSCNCCHKPWKYIEGNINSAMTDKGNKAICDECFNKLKERKS